jgi:hypothetical protein
MKRRPDPDAPEARTWPVVETFDRRGGGLVAIVPDTEGIVACARVAAVMFDRLARSLEETKPGLDVGPPLDGSLEGSPA